MSYTPNYDAAVKTILDATTPGERTCALTGEKWMMKEEEIGWYKKFNVPPSTLSPFTMWKARIFGFTGYQFWYNHDAKTGKQIVTHIHPATKWKVMEDKNWYEEDFSTINLSFDSSIPFFDYIEGLTWQVPVNAYSNFEEVKNSIAIVSCGDVNSYFTITTKSRNTFYSADAINLEDCMDVFVSRDIERCYDVLHSYRITGSQVVRESRDCFNSFFIFDCRNCESCFLSWNQRNKKFLWLNEQLTEAEWKKRRAAIDLGKRSVFEKLEREFREHVHHDAVWPENFNDRSETSTGDYSTDCAACTNVWFAEYSNNCHYGSWLKESRDCYQVDAPYSTNCYNSIRPANLDHCICTWACARIQSSEYCINCYDCEYCFGCVGIRHKKYHIFNKEYSEDAYWQKVDELKCAMLDRGEYGRFFPMKFAQGYPPFTGLGWVFGLLDYDQLQPFDAPKFRQGDHGAFGPLADRLHEARDSHDLPDSIDDLDESWAGIPIVDGEYQRPFSIPVHEIPFRKTYRIAPNTRHFLRRFWDKHHDMNLAIQEPATCGSCRKQITTAHNIAYPNRKVYCAACYAKYLEKNS